MTYRDVLTKYLTAEELTAFSSDDPLWERECATRYLRKAIFEMGWWGNRCVEAYIKYHNITIEDEPFWNTLKGRV